MGKKLCKQNKKMGRLVIADGQTNKTIEKLYISGKWKIGLIIGQQTLQKDICLQLIETPLEESEKEDGPRTSINCINDVSDVFLKSHALQVLRMFPGGLDVIGILAYAPSQMFQISQAKIKQLLFSTYKAIQKSSDFSQLVDRAQDKIVLQICSTTRSFTCKCYDMHDTKVGPKPADWKEAHTPENWTQLNTSLFLDSKFYIPSDKSTTSMFKQFLVGVKPFCQDILHAECVIDDKLLINDSEPLLEVTKLTSNKKGKKQAVELKEKIHKFVDLLFPSTSFSQCDKSIEFDSTAKMHLHGMIVGRAYVHNKATISEVKAAIKEDLIRSILTRIHLLSEEIEQTEEYQDRKILYEMPKRCFAPVESNGVQYCDYMFPDESVTDALDRFNDIFHLQYNTDDIDDKMETFPSEDELIKSMECNEIVEEKQELSNKSTPIKSLTTALSIATSGVVALIALGISFIYLE